jgi:hypothetical protein
MRVPRKLLYQQQAHMTHISPIILLFLLQIKSAWGLSRQLKLGCECTVLLLRVQ